MFTETQRYFKIKGLPVECIGNMLNNSQETSLVHGPSQTNYIMLADGIAVVRGENRVGTFIYAKGDNLILAWVHESDYI